MSSGSLSAHAARAALGASAIGGLALWFSRGELDVAGTAVATYRVAMLPSWPELVGLVILMLIAAAAAALTLQRMQGTRSGGKTLAWDPTFNEPLRPLFALAILALPYVPWIPDWIPALRLLAGPMRWLMWAVVLGQVSWILLPRLAAPVLGAPRSVNPGVASLAVFAVSFAVYAGVSTRFTNTGIFPSGDEPHYLVMMQSLLRDHDLKIANNHERRDYDEYFPSSLKPDYQARGADGEIYSIHPVGLPVLAAPAFAIAGYRGVVWLIALLAAGTAALLWRWTLALTGSAGAATFAWAAVGLSAPWVFNSFTVYPEIPAAFCVMLAASALRPAVSAAHARNVAVRVWPGALAVAALPWFHTKYTGMAIVLAGVLAWRHRRPGAVSVVLGSLTISLLGWFTFFYRIWGSPLPSAPYARTQTSILTFASGGPGLLFDQEYGVCAYAPVLGLGLIGLAGMWRDRSMRGLAVELLLTGLPLVVLVGSFAQWWGGSAMPGRQIVSMLPLFGAPIAWHYKRVAERPLRSAGSRLLLLISLVVTVTMTVAVNGGLVVQGRDGLSSILQWLSPTWHLWTAAPTYIFSSPAAASARSLLWLAGAALVAWLCRRPSKIAPGSASLRVTLYAAIVCMMVISTAAALPGSDKQPRFDPEARALFPMLETFDAAVRPVGVRYDPFSVVSPSAIPPLFSLTAVPGQRLARQPLRVVLNARFRLPAGEYEVELKGSDIAGNVPTGTMGLQIGREGGPVQTWPFTVSRGSPWRRRFRIPIDAEFVGFRTSPEVARAVGALRLQPLQILDVGRRLRTGTILSAASFGSTAIFFHDEAYAELDGFWVEGQTTVHATVMKGAPSAEAITLNLHCGARPNVVTLATPHWSERVEVVPNVTRTVVVPSDRRESLLSLEITTSSGFVPAEVEPGNSDRRLLGCWIAFAS